MRLESKKYLFDMLQAGEWIASFTAGRSFTDYEAQPMLRLAVERCFSILGEALSQLAKVDTSLAEQIPEFRRIIAFRNILIHAYAQTDPGLVWDMAETKLPVLLGRIRELVDWADRD